MKEKSYVIIKEERQGYLALPVEDELPQPGAGVADDVEDLLPGPEVELQRREPGHGGEQRGPGGRVAAAVRPEELDLGHAGQHLGVLHQLPLHVTDEVLPVDVGGLQPWLSMLQETLKKTRPCNL